jgi:hypothetical protein
MAPQLMGGNQGLGIERWCRSGRMDSHRYWLLDWHGRCPAQHAVIVQQRPRTGGGTDGVGIEGAMRGAHGDETDNLWTQPDDATLAEFGVVGHPDERQGTPT